VAYEQGDARTFKGDGEVAAAYMLDIVHHIAPDTVPPLLRRLHACLAPGGVLVVKDVDTRPAPKRWFTWTLDKLMAPTTPVRYWSGDELGAALRERGSRCGVTRCSTSFRIRTSSTSRPGDRSRRAPSRRVRRLLTSLVAEPPRLQPAHPEQIDRRLATRDCGRRSSRRRKRRGR